jgi:hypothetical protein
VAAPSRRPQALHRGIVFPDVSAVRPLEAVTAETHEALRGAGIVAAVLATLWLVTTAVPAAAQTPMPPAQGGFPDASFDVTFLKFMPPANVYSPFYSWDAHMALDLTVARNGRNVVSFATEFQTAGTENLGTKVSVGGTGYIIRATYTRVWSPDLALSVGVSHLSSHLTRDLDAKTAEARARGLPIPNVQDPSEYNVLFFRASHRFSTWPHAPVIDVAIEPLNFRFDGRKADSVRPIYMATNLTLWRGHEKSLVAETHHEFGTRPWNQFSLFLELYARHQAEGRFQIFLTASPGHSLHVSPNVGAVRDGIAAGVRLAFRS